MLGGGGQPVYHGWHVTSLQQKAALSGMVQ
jgi:hypothetical protein